MKIIKILSLLLCLSSPAFAKVSNDFEMKEIGFKFTKPATWHFMKIDREIYEAAKMAPKDLEDVMKDAAILSQLIVITKYPESYTKNDLNPTFQVALESNERLKNLSVKAALQEMIDELKYSFAESTIGQKPIETIIDGNQAAYARINYLETTLKGKNLPVAFQVWIVPSKDYLFVFSALTRQDQSNGSRLEIKKILDSVRIEKVSLPQNFFEGNLAE